MGSSADPEALSESALQDQKEIRGRGSQGPEGRLESRPSCRRPQLGSLGQHCCMLGTLDQKAQRSLAGPESAGGLLFCLPSTHSFPFCSGHCFLFLPRPPAPVSPLPRCGHVVAFWPIESRAPLSGLDREKHHQYLIPQPVCWKSSPRGPWDHMLRVTESLPALCLPRAATEFPLYCVRWPAWGDVYRDR